MSTTVNEAFNNFNKDHVNLDPDRTDIARTSRDWLMSQLSGLPGKVVDFPNLYAEKDIHYGSFARNTKIRELDDIDIILGIHAQGATYEIIIPGKEYTLKPQPGASELLKLCNEDGTLNSIKFVNKIVSSLDGIPQYKSSDKHRRQEAATLNLTSYEWCFDIVPAFYAGDSEHYLIPDGNGRWKATDPRVDEERVNRINLKHKGKILQLIRTLKFWNKRAMMTTIPSYLFENIILDYFDNQPSISDYIDINLRDFWEYLMYGIYYTVQDPKGFQGELNTLTLEEHESISAKAEDAYDKSLVAFNLETVDHDQSAAIKKWAEIFGSNFS